jgi:glycosyltransferase involved in cell wall biosynthesis
MNQPRAARGRSVAGGAAASGERVRVLRIIARLNIGGPALHTTLLTERLDPRRYDARLVAGAEAPDEGNYAALHGAAPPRLTVLPALGREVRGVADAIVFGQLLRLMRALRPHVVHTHTAKAGTLGRLAARVARVPVVVHTYHGHVFHGYFPPGRTRVFLAIERALGRWTDSLLAVSETVRRDLLALGVGSPGSFRVMPLGLDLDRYAAADDRKGELCAELGVSRDVPLVAIVARLVPIKAHEMFLRAAARVREKLPTSQFLVVGDGERRHALEMLAGELGLGASVRFLGWRRDLDRVYTDAWIVALTSLNEGSPVSLIEAMAAGRPVVATCVGGVPDLVEEGVTGHLVPPGDADALARAMTDLLLDAERRRAFGLAGRARVVPVFGASRLVADMDALYAELLRAKGVTLPW